MIANNLYNDLDPKTMAMAEFKTLAWTGLKQKDAIQEKIALLNKGRYTQKKYLHQLSSKNGMRTTRW